MFPILMRGKLRAVAGSRQRKWKLAKLQELPETPRKLANSHPLIIVHSEEQNCVLADRPIVPIGL
jgi:hypothetical protein